MLDFIARPFGILLMFLYDLVNNYGLAILLFAAIIKLILLPFQMKSKRGQIQQAALQPKLAELQKKYGTNKTKLNEETAKLYKEEGINPASGCIWGILPLPILFALFQVIRQPITLMMGVAHEQYDEIAPTINEMILARNPEAVVDGTYAQITQAQFLNDNSNIVSEVLARVENLRGIDFSFFNIDLGVTPQWDFLWNANMDIHATWIAGFVIFLLPFLSAGSQFLASALNRKMNPAIMPEGQGKSMQTMMMLMPLMSVWFGFILPAALSFYWTTSTLLQVAQDVWLTKVYKKRIEAEEAIKNEERTIKEAEIEAKRLETERKKAEGLLEQNPNTSKRKKQKGAKREQLDKAAQWEKKNAPVEEKYEPSRIGNRRYARGRAYDPDRYTKLTDEDGGENSEFEIRNPELLDDVKESGDPSDAEDVSDDASDDDNESYEIVEGDKNIKDIKDDEPVEDEEDKAPTTARFETKRFDDD